MAGRWWRWPVVVLAGAGLAGAGFWAGSTAVAPAPVPADVAASALVVAVSEQTVGRTLNLGVSVEQPKRALAVNALAGVVTKVARSGTFKVGDTVYAVNRVPVRVVSGTLPFYRDLTYRTKGEDVAQLRAALVKLGYAKASGSVFDYQTRVAVRAWQKELGLPQTGTIGVGELIAVPRLPAALLIDGELVSVGGRLAGGEKLVSGSSGEPRFRLVLNEQQARLVPATATVAMEYQDKQWQAVVAGTETNTNDETVMTLTAPDGGPVCGKDCALVATGTTLNILAQVAIVPPATGPAVPVAAITTEPDGSTTVTVVGADDTRTPRVVTLVGSQDGVAIVDGVQVGEQVQVFAAEPGASPVPAQPDSAEPGAPVSAEPTP